MKKNFKNMKKKYEDTKNQIKQLKKRFGKI